MADILELGAFIPRPEATLKAELYTLGFPASWRTLILDLYRAAQPARYRDKIEAVPIARLNEVLRAVAPDLISVGTRASFDETTPWLYTTAPYPDDVVRRFVRIWLRDFASTPELYNHYKRTLDQLDINNLAWQSQNVDLLEHEISPAGTCIPGPHIYDVLTDLIADRIAQHTPYFHAGVEHEFHRVASGGDGAELISWPPIKHTVENKDGQVTGEWLFCANITVTLRTVPFDRVPRLHISTGIRRWVRGRAFLPRNRAASVYLHTDTALLDDAPPSKRFAVAKLIWSRGDRKVEWRRGGPEGMLHRLHAIDNLPLADVFSKEADAWIEGKDGVTAAVCHHNMMGYHGVGTGLMPAEHRRLTEWIAAALEPDFIRAPDLVVSKVRARQVRALQKPESLPKKEDFEGHRAAVQARRDRTVAANGAVRRHATAKALGEGRSLVVHVLNQDTEAVPAIIAAAEESLDLSGYRTVSGPHTWAWQAADLTVRIHTRLLGAVGQQLGGDKPPTKGKEHNEAVAARRHEVQQLMDTISRETEHGQLALVQIDGIKPPSPFAVRTRDPKFAIRLGCADTGVVTQFITTDEEDLAVRAKMIWDDGLRQLSMRFVPQSQLSVPENLNQLAFWLVRRQSDSTNSTAQFTPVAILIRPDENVIKACTPDTGGWVPYSELLLSLTGKVRPQELRSREAQERLVVQFVRQMIYKLRFEPTLVFVHAQNLRSRWSWLTNAKITPDRIQFGDAPAQKLSAWPNTRIVRVATSQRSETARCWMPKAGDSAGHSTGLWASADSDDQNRVYYSTSPKSSTANKKLVVDAAKLTPNIMPDGKLGPSVAGMNAWNPQLVELTMIGFESQEEAEIYAMYTHRQRFTEDYRDALRLPLALHLAELSSEYALPFADDDNRADDDDPTANDVEIEADDDPEL